MGPPIESRAELERVLKADLGLCTCAHADTLPFLREFLRLVAERTDAMNDADRVRRVHQDLSEVLDSNGSAAMRNWFVYAIDRAGLVAHNFNLYDLMIMDRGRWILDALERFPQPVPLVDEDNSEPSKKASTPQPGGAAESD